MEKFIQAAAGAAKSAISAGHDPADAFTFAGALFALVAPPIPQPSTPIEQQPAPITSPSLLSRLQQAVPQAVAAPGAIPAAFKGA